MTLEYVRGSSVSCIEEKHSVNPDLVIHVSCVSPADKQHSKLSVWIRWQLPQSATTHNGPRQWHSFIEVANDRRSHVDYIAETDTDHKRLDLPTNQLFDIRVCLSVCTRLRFAIQSWLQLWLN